MQKNERSDIESFPGGAGSRRPKKPIRRDFSISFQFRYCVAMVAGSAICTLLVYLYFDRGMGESYFDSLLTLRHLEQALPASIVLTFFVQLLLILLLTIAINLFVSHKIAGPIYRFEISLKKILEGDLREDVRTRNHDQLKTMVDSLNRLQTHLRSFYSEAGLVRKEASKALKCLERGEQCDVGSLRSRIDSLRRQMRRQEREGGEGAMDGSSSS